MKWHWPKVKPRARGGHRRAELLSIRIAREFVTVGLNWVTKALLKIAARQGPQPGHCPPMHRANLAGSRLAACTGANDAMCAGARP